MKKVATVVLLLSIFVQFIEFKRDTPKPTKNGFESCKSVPKEVVKILKNSCYDCHSDNVELKWFDKIAPITWYVQSNIKKAKQSLNFSSWKNMEDWQERLFLQGAIIYDIEKAKMPPKSYLFLHPDAKVDKKDLELLKGWLSSLDFTKGRVCK